MLVWFFFSISSFIIAFLYFLPSLVAQTVKNPPAMRETWVWSLGWEDPLEEATPVSLPWESPWIEEPGGLQSMGSQRVRHNWATELNWTEGFERQLGHEGRATMNEIDGLIKEAWESSLLRSAMWGNRKSVQRRVPTQPCWHPDLRLPFL